MDEREPLMNADERRFEPGKMDELTQTDLLVEGVLLVELKAVKTFDDVHMAQCLNYLRATDLRLCLLMNFGKPKVEVRRIANNY
jgi:GxxExxY protein